jgi:serine/threonine-protein kinase ULK/ATG1
MFDPLRQVQSFLFVVLELCEGEGLATFMRRNGRVDELVARNFMNQIGNSIVSRSIAIHLDSVRDWGI